MFSPMIHDEQPPVVLGTDPMTVVEFDQVCRGRQLVVAPAVWDRMASSERHLAAALDGGATVYGVTTGFGARSTDLIEPAQRPAFQLATIRSHACGSGPLTPWDEARGVWLAKAASLATGLSGASAALVRSMTQLLNAGFAPAVPLAGSLGASGDLIPSGHAALPLAGEGELLDAKGELVLAAEALADIGLEPVILGPRDGLSLVNGTAMTLSLAVHACLALDRLIRSADWLVSATLEASGGHRDAFSTAIVGARPHPGASATAAAVLDGLNDVDDASMGTRGVHDSYAWRCVPQVHGSARSAQEWARSICGIELGSCTDNPIVAADGALVSGGNFHAAPLGLTMDTAALAIGEVAALSRQRLVQLSALASPEDSAGIGLTMLVTTATASLLEMSSTGAATGRWLPVDSVEDHVSNATLAARRALRAVELTAHVLATEAVGLRSLDRPVRSDAGKWARQLVDDQIPQVSVTQPLSAGIAAVATRLMDPTVVIRLP